MVTQSNDLAYYTTPTVLSALFVAHSLSAKNSYQLTILSEGSTHTQKYTPHLPVNTPPCSWHAQQLT